VKRKRSFGISTHLYHGVPLSRNHLLEIAAFGFDAVDLRATRTHFDYHGEGTIADLNGWLAEAGLSLNAVHAPLGGGFFAGGWSDPFSLASPDAAVRARAVSEAELALQIARWIPFRALIVHLGVPRASAAAASDNSRDAARRSVEELQELAEPLGVRLAVEVIPNELSRAGSLANFVERVIDVANVGICLDMGHAHMDGDLIDAIETVSEHLLAVELHDNRRRSDDHLVPFEGTIDWPVALTSVQKVGYDGTLTLELARRGSTTKETLARARQARQRMDRMLTV
jgi:sugar phosphate isomerase/epimerase